MSQPSKNNLNPLAISKADAASMLSKVGGKTITLAMIEADLAAGAPVQPDGTINLVHYAAWLLLEMHRGS